ncbi:MAG TPA: hypothetical protein VIH97_15175 [Candidatus Acidoferrales bacterium]|jgi:hypothetical protein
MSDDINRVPRQQVPPQQAPRNRINWRPIGLTILWALLLGVSSCFGAILSHGKTLSVIFSAVFIVCVLAFVGGLLWALGLLIERMTRGDRHDG